MSAKKKVEKIVPSIAQLQYPLSSFKVHDPVFAAIINKKNKRMVYKNSDYFINSI